MVMSADVSRTKATDFPRLYRRGLQIQARRPTQGQVAETATLQPAREGYRSRMEADEVRPRACCFFQQQASGLHT